MQQANENYKNVRMPKTIDKSMRMSKTRKNYNNMRMPKTKQNLNLQRYQNAQK